MKKWQLIGLYYMAGICLLHSVANAQNITCNNAAYYVSASIDDKSTNFYRIMLPGSSGNPRVELIREKIPRIITAIGYRFEDQRIYGLDADTHELLQIDALGNVTALAIPEALNTSLDYTAGTLSPFDRHLVVIGKNKTSQTDEVVHTIQLYSDRYYAGVTSVVSDFGGSIDDVAIDPTRGLAYGFDRSTRKLVDVRLSDGFMTNFFAQSMPNIGAISSMFFDQEGQLYGIGGSSPTSNNQLFRINKLNGAIEILDVANLPSGNLSDACSCPYSLEIIQSSSATVLAPCQEFEIKYQLINHTGGARSYTSFIDTLPNDFEVVEVLEKPFSGTVSGLGTNVFALERMDLLLDTSEIVIRVEASDFALGQYRSQPILEGTFANIPILKTQTTWNVKTDGLLDLENALQSDCESGELILSTQLPDARFLWNTGDTTAQIRVSEPGWYSVTASLDCITAVDSIEITAFPEIFSIEVIAPKNTIAGQALSLQVQSDVALVTYAWGSSPASNLSCTDCPNPLAYPIQDIRFELVATDAFGCTARHSINVKVQISEDVYAPTAFSPNGDGINDFFYLQALAGTAKIEELQIFNRWGNLVFEQKNVALNAPSEGWDGAFGAQNAEQGTYFWKASLLLVNGSRTQMAGALQLMR